MISSKGSGQARLRSDLVPRVALMAHLKSNYAPIPVTYGNMQQVGASRLLGNPTGAPANPSEISLGGTLLFSGSVLETGAGSGDVTWSTNSFSTAISAGAVTYGKMQNVSASRLLGNPTGSPASPSEISLGATLAFSGTFVVTGAGTGDATWNSNSFATSVVKVNGVSYPPSPSNNTVPVVISSNVVVYQQISGSQVSSIPSNKITGTTTNDNAPAGDIGEYVTATQGVAQSLTSGSVLNLTSISLTGGDWDVSGMIGIQPAGTTNEVLIFGVISLANNNLTSVESAAGPVVYGWAETGINQYLPVPVNRVSLSGTTTIFLNVQAIFSVSTCTATGFIRARRMR